MRSLEIVGLDTDTNNIWKYLCQRPYRLALVALERT